MNQNGEELEPLRSEVEWAINQLPLGKSAGNDAIHGELIKASEEEGISIYHKLCTKNMEIREMAFGMDQGSFCPHT